MRKPTAAEIESVLTHDYVTAAEAAHLLGLNKSHLCLQLRLGRVPGAFQWGSSPIWVVPRSGIEDYRARRTGDSTEERDA